MTVNYTYSPEQERLREKARQFAEQFISPEALEYDRRGEFPLETIQKMGQEGLFAPVVPKEYGGLGLSTLEYGLVIQEIAAASPAYTHNGQFQTQKGILSFGSQEQKKRYLPKLATAEAIGAIAISEPNVGSSFRKMETLFLKRKDGYLLNGHKTHINDAAEADVMLLLANGEKGLTAFILEKNLPGISSFKKLDPMGYRSSPIYEFSLQDLFLPETQRLGEEGQGLPAFFKIFNFSRIGNTSVFIGLSRGALRAAIRYIQTREVGDAKVTSFQGIRWILAELFTKMEAAELLRNKAAILESSELPCARETSMAKYFAGEVAREVTNKAIEVTGSFGCYRDQPFEMFYRDAKVLLVAGGSSEVMKNVIADLTLGKS